jgi:hypothetical protein
VQLLTAFQQIDPLRRIYCLLESIPNRSQFLQNPINGAHDSVPGSTNGTAKKLPST